ncbi:Nif3-like dinuclear metal center hexameric protein [Thermodesulfobacteriota bacterium]
MCTGSGSSLLNDFIASEAHVFISGDLGYHAARTIEAANLGLIDIGHFASEHLIVDVLANRLKKVLPEKGFDEVSGLKVPLPLFLNEQQV